ncbi:DUF4197 domain-containing protein [Xylophilus sp. GOD-11R]|uniref:DUF4197 domain-containing protein n=1 Tax=Xylophilus sp. GOD-11R TaxID=3089814 RepID=UPI00298C60C4|nr:DUF4197 domain-containing protein [Xylophilus sp. GOD-11R]WPB57239.1 DUF4197 domain-containing protein [Xylophilus sp. GOD-11R]
MHLRHTLAAAAAVLSIATISLPAAAQSGGSAIKSMLGQASDNALDQLAKPGAFSADDAIRIGLPGASGKGMGKLMDLAGKTGLTGDINGSLNRAAEEAASKAKPIFRAAIDRATLKDAAGMLKDSTGATEYLKQSTGPEIAAQLRPLVKTALANSGVLQQTSQLSAVGFTDDKLTDYVTGKTSDGIFTYVGREETKMRQNPQETGKTLLKGLGKF